MEKPNLDLLPVDPGGIPVELKARDQWVVWKIEYRDEKPTKVPHDPFTRGRAKSTDPTTWRTFLEAFAEYKLGDWDGIGYVFSKDDPYVGIDLDHCHEAGEPQPWTADQRAKSKWSADFPDPVDIIKACGTYAEVSPSGTGVKIIGRAKLPGTGRKRGDFEAYDQGRYFTVTGAALNGQSVADCQAAVDRLYLGCKSRQESAPTTTPSTSAEPSIDGYAPNVDEVVVKASNCKAKAKFQRLYHDGDTGEYPSPSEADAALAGMLAFWCGPRPDLIEQVMRQSKLVRDKWDREDYLPRTIKTALEGCTDFYDWEKGVGDDADGDPGMIKTLADAICTDNHFAQDGGGKLYRFVGGVYKRQAENFVKARVKKLLIDRGEDKKWSSRLASEVVEFNRVDAPELWDRPPQDVLNVENGLLKVAGRELNEHDPAYLSTVQLPVKYDPTAKCPCVEDFVSQTFPGDAYDLAWELIAWLMLPDTAIQKAVLLTGEGANGKSIYLNMLTVFLGRSNVSGVSLHKLEDDKFAVARLIGKLANICPDLPSTHLQSTSTFKAITGGDAMPAEYKFKDSFEFTPFARLVFSANHPPQSGDGSYAFFRRWLVIPFTRTFEPHEQIPRDVLDEMLTRPGELSGMLNKALDALERLNTQRAFSEPESVKAAWTDFHATTDPLAVWLDRFTVDAPDASVPKATLRVAYNADAEQHARPRMDNKAFGAAFKRLRPAVFDCQRTVNHKVVWCYGGIGLLHSDEKDFTRFTQFTQ